MSEITQMPETVDGETTTVPAKDRADWQKPVLTRLAVGQAEVGPNGGASDGEFTTS